MVGSDLVVGSSSSTLTVLSAGHLSYCGETRDLGRNLVRVKTTAVAFLALVSLSMVGLNGAAAAKGAPGSTRWCRHHPRSALIGCQRTGGGSPSVLTLTVSPDPIVEVGDSDVYAEFSVAVDPVYAGLTVDTASALNDRCRQGVTWTTNQGSFSGSTAAASIDDEGNATFEVLGVSCASGPLAVVADVEGGTNPTSALSVSIEPPEPVI
jgi:hypothetical protein